MEPVTGHRGGRKGRGGADRFAAEDPVLGRLQEPRALGSLSGTHQMVSYC